MKYEVTMFAIVYVLVDVYDRLIQSGKKPGFLQLLATQTVSAIWHVSKIYLHFKLIAILFFFLFLLYLVYA